MVDCVFRQEHILQTIFIGLDLKSLICFIKTDSQVYFVCSESNAIKKYILSNVVDNWIDAFEGLNKAFIMSIYHDNFKVFCELLKRGVDPSFENDEAIVSACARGQYKFVDVLLECGCINPGTRSNLPLLLAIQSGQVEIVKLLLQDSRVNPNDRHGACGKVLALIGNEHMTNVFKFKSCFKNESL